MSVVLLDLGLVLQPDLHPEALLLAVLPISTHGVSIVPGVGLPVLQLPGLQNFNHEENNTKEIIFSPPTPR